MRQLINFTLFLAIASLVVACKPKGEKAETGDAQEVTQAAGKEYTVDVAGSKILWEGTKVTGKHNGDLSLSEGKVVFSDGALAGGSFIIDMNSVNSLDVTGDSKVNLDNHLKGTVEGKETDFFNTPKYPTAKFEITKATKLMNNPDANYVVNGNLTLKDQTKGISFRAKVEEANGMVTVSTPNFVIDRTDWGIQYGSARFIDGIGDRAIGDDIGLQINLVAK